MTETSWRMGIGNGKIWIKTDRYDPDVNDDLKRLASPRWNKAERRWEFGLVWDTCIGARKIADKYGKGIRITRQLREWAEIEKSRQDTIPDVQHMDLIDLPIVEQEAPRLHAALQNRPFQTVGVAFAARNRSCLIADQPGLGKTLQAIGAVIESETKGPILVVAPKAAAKLTWPQELAQWSPNDYICVIGSHLNVHERNAMVAEVQSLRYRDERVWVITSPNYIRIRAKIDDFGNFVKVKGKKVIEPVQEGLMSLFDVKWSAIIVDESHDTLAGASPGIGKKKWSAQRLGLGALDVKKDGLRIAMSGTPFRGKESYLWGQLNWLRPDLYRSFWRWCNDHFQVTGNGFGTEIGKMVDASGMYAEARNVMLRRTKAEVAPDLPPKQYPGWPLDPEHPDENIAIWLDMDPKQAKAYSGMEKHAAAEIDGGILTPNAQLAIITRLKQFAGSYGRLVENDEGHGFQPTLPSNKFEWLVEWLDERGINKGALALKDNSREWRRELPKVIVVSQFTSLLNVMAKGLNDLMIPSYKFTGETSDPDREMIKENWQNNPEDSTRVMFLATKAGGVSLTLDRYDDMILMDETDTVSDQEQVEDRIHRLSNIDHQVNIWRVFSRGTVEERIARQNVAKEADLKDIIDGERGVEFARQLLVVCNE